MPGRRLPRGHEALLGNLVNLAGPFEGVPIGEQAERGHLARPMAARAVLPQKRCDVLVVSYLLGTGRGGQAEGQQQEDRGTLHGEKTFRDARWVREIVTLAQPLTPRPSPAAGRGVT